MTSIKNVIIYTSNPSLYEVAVVHLGEVKVAASNLGFREYRTIVIVEFVHLPSIYRCQLEVSRHILGGNSGCLFDRIETLPGGCLRLLR